MTLPVIIIGAGMAGLATAIALQQQGREVLVLEAGEAEGGVVRSERVDGYQIEHGPNTVQASGKNLQYLIDAIGLRQEVLYSSAAAKNRYIFREGKLCRLPSAPPGLLTTTALSGPGKWRMVQEPWQPRPSRRDAEESVAAFMERRLGPEAVAYLVDPFISGIYAGEARQLEVASAFPALVEFESSAGSLMRGAMAARKQAKRAGEPAPPKGLLSFRTGLQRLPQRLAELLGDRLHCQTPVEGLSPRDGGWEVVAGGESWRASEVVMATPAVVSAKLIDALDPKLSGLLREIPYAPIAGVHLGYPDAAFAQIPSGFGVLIPRNQGIPLLGALFLSSLFPERAPAGHTLLTCFIGGFTNPGALELDDAALVRQVHEALSQILGVRTGPTWQRIVRWRQAIPQYVPGHGVRMKGVRQRLQQQPGLHLVGNFDGGISLDQVAGNGLKLAERMRQ